MYPIRTVSKLTGLSLDTLRAWERRYQVVRPARDDRGRVYSDSDVQRLRLLREAVERGYAIGQVASMEDERLRALLASEPFRQPAPEPAASRSSSEAAVRAILDAVLQFDAGALDRELARSAVLLPPHELVHEVVVPLLQRIGEGWEAGTIGIAHEHMTSGALRSLLGTLVRLHARPEPTARLLFATPSDERHELGILIAAMLAAGAGFECIYLGPDLPDAEIVEGTRTSASRVVVLGVTGASDPSRSLESVRQISEELAASAEVWVGGFRSQELERGLRRLRVRLFESLRQYEVALDTLRRPSLP